ncbi:hypothetical protein QBC35DRAFT_431993 [Podospora australis]|uniref:HMG box domain-containing protein n=1 Tax=Podospora australis TaxID=1536484 RepID=A0AAN6WVL6_9PEZI|nr:hypothetical protein QBC35DRAFT_431993 [Podospora australis]
MTEAPNQNQPQQQQNQGRGASTSTGPLTRSAMSAAAARSGIGVHGGGGGGRGGGGGGSTGSGSGNGGGTTAVARQQQSQQEATNTPPLNPPAAPPLPHPPSTSSVSSYSSSASQSVPRPPPPLGPITRKRAASINTEEANREKIENFHLNTPSTGGSSSDSRHQQQHQQQLQQHQQHQQHQQPQQQQSFDPTGGRQELICLCTAPPKIPRPRNAFILYRQHHQANVVQSNPGLANPEISKIIGEQWRNESEAVKNQWKQLAEEEKLRHQVQNPGYRYQPRRGNKSGAPSSRPPVGPGEDPYRCPNCGGRYIATPRTPSTPFMTPTAARNPLLPQQLAMGGTGLGPGTPYPGVGTGSHQYPPPPPAHPRSSSVQWGGSGSNLYDIQEDVYSPTEAKRRMNYSNYLRQSVSHHPSQSHHHSLPGSPTPGYGPGPVLPVPPNLGLGGPPSAGMGPPPRPGSMTMSSPYPPIPGTSNSGGRDSHRSSVVSMSSAADLPQSSFDESLRLPPLQTHIYGGPGPSTSSYPPGPASTGSGPIYNPSSSGHGFGLGILNPPPYHPRLSSLSDPSAQSSLRAVEAMVMSISYLNKLRVLERISPSLTPPLSPSSFSQQQTHGRRRGPIIAVEGPDVRLLKIVSGVITRAFASVTDQFDVRTWEDSTSRAGSVLSARSSISGRETRDRDSRDREGGGGRDSGKDKDREKDRKSPFEVYLSTITEWHAKSAEIVRFVTGETSTSSSAPGADHEASGTSRSQSGSGSSTPRPGQRHPLPSLQHYQKLPIALLPTGFQLSLSDRFACSIPIADSYAPVDHWQWMATLWRGVVGADLVVYVRPSYPEETQAQQTPAQQGQVGVGVGIGTVEVKAAGLIVVKVPVSFVSSPSGSQGSAASSSVPPATGTETVVQMDEKMERRLGFEIVEWVRGGGWERGGLQGQHGQGGMGAGLGGERMEL